MPKLRTAFLILVSTFVSPVSAQDLSAQAQAEALFREGLELMEQGSYDTACPKLVASNQLDPAPGTMLNLGHCYERAKKLASAWAAYTSAAAEGDKAGRTSWADQARRKAAELEPVLNWIVITVEAKPTNLRIRLNGVVIPEPAWGTALPVDPGAHLIEVDAPGRLPWQKMLEVRGAATREAVIVPDLAFPTAETPSPNPSSTKSSEAKPSSGASSAAPWIVIGVSGAVTAAGLGLYLDGSRRLSDAEEICVDRRCPSTPEGQAALTEGDEARTQKNWGVVVGAVGILGIAGGATWLLLQKRSADNASSMPRPTLVPTLSQDYAGLALDGTF
jgi:hypothetical protein